MAHTALSQLHGSGPWEWELQPLYSKDICGPTAALQGDIDDVNDVVGSNGHARLKKQREAQQHGLGEGYWMTSWIWACGTVMTGESAVIEGIFLSTQ